MSTHTRRDFLKLVGAMPALGLLSKFAQAEQRHRPPNIVLIMTDDQGWGDISSHDNAKIDTPVMDKLAGQGARFDRFYVCPVCAPTRASLLTGRYHLRTGTHGVTRGQENMRGEEVTVAEALRQEGYATGCFGKWHNRAHWPYHPNGQGFDEFLGFCSGHWNNYFDTTLDHNGKMVASKGYIADVFTDAAIEFIEKNRRRPFLCYVPYNTPHSPFQVPDKYFDKYKARGLDDKLACIYGMCENLDDNLGRILSKLDELKLGDDTIVLFLTDNGPNSDRFNGFMKGRKGSVDEGGIRVPLFVRWPGHITAGTAVEPISAHIDVFPTLMELCGLKMPKTLPLDGRSVAGLLKGSRERWPERMIFTFRSTGLNSKGSVRTQKWRAVRSNRGWHLFDMEADPSQKKDVAKEHPAVTARFEDAFEAKVKEVTSRGLKSLPIPIGYSEWPEVNLPGHEAFLEPPDKKGISYVGPNGWANDWITNWTSTDAYAWWDVDVVRGGKFELTLMYVCGKKDLGCRMAVEIGGERREVVVDREHDPKPIESPDRVSRGEVYEKIWRPLRVGTVGLVKGGTKLVVRAVGIPGGRAADIKAVKVRRIQ